MTTRPDDKPFFLRGNFAPVPDELTAHDLPVEGELPPELDGTYLRNGPNPRTGVSPHWLVGDGMIHGVHLAGGRARWYRNRYPRTARITGEPVSRLRGGASSNTHVIEHAGRILSLVEAALPMEVDRELATVGVFDFEGAVDTAVTAHPKRCALTGELHFYGYQYAPPHLTYYVADRTGRVVHRREIDVAGASFMHDFALTERHAVFFDTPVRMIADWGGAPGLPFAWSDTHAPRAAVVPRDGGEVRWFDVEPCHLGHTVNAFEQGDRVVVEAVRYDRLEGAMPSLRRWELDLDTGRAREETLDDRLVEFPRVDERRVGRAHRYTYVVELRMVDGEPAGSLLRRYDTRTGASLANDLGRAQMPGECVFVPAAAAAPEDGGWLLAYVYDAERDGSDLVVLDARAFDAPPVARVRLPRRVPFGFHGSWAPSAAA